MDISKSPRTQAISYAPDLMVRSKIDLAARHYGVEILHVSSDKEFRESVQESPGVRLILIDVDLPGADTIELIREARAASGARIIGFCSHVLGEMFENARMAGATAVVANSTFHAGIPGYFAPLAAPAANNQ